MADTLLQMPDLPARRKAVMHAEAVAVRAGQYEAANPITLEQAVLMLCKDSRWQNAGVLNARLYLKWRDDEWPRDATGQRFDFRENEAISIGVKAMLDGTVTVTRQILTEPGDEIRHDEFRDRILWKRSHDTGKIDHVKLAKNPFAGWLDVALTLEGLSQTLLAPPSDDAA